MRTISTAQEAALVSPSRSDHMRVRIDSDGLGTWVDLTDLYGIDWVRSATIREGVDSIMASATIELTREYEELSLAGMMTGSRVNAASTVVDIAREIKIETATIGGDDAPASGDWVLVFHGFVDDIDFGGNNPVMRLICRDKGAELADTFIESVAIYGSAGGQAVQTAMQNILNANLGSPPTLYVPTSPGWNILEYKQDKEPVLSAVRKLADQIGWDLRYKWRSGTAQYELTLYAPDRALVGGSLRTFDSAEYYSVTQAAISRKNIRNRIKITYSDPTQEIRDVGGSPYRCTYIAEDAASKTKYGTRYMEIAESSSSNIDSAAEAQVMAENIRDDLKEPTLTHVIELPYFWPAELADYYTFAANGTHYDTNQSLAVVGFTHSLTRDKCRTTLETRGRPSAGTRRWLEIEGRPGVGPATDDYNDAAAANPAGEAGGPGHIIVSYDDPRVAAPPVSDWAYTECHVSDSGGFTPSNSTLKAVGRATRFDIGDLVAGDTYYIKLIIFDSENNVASTSAQVTQAAGLVGPKQISPESEIYANIVPNSALSVWTPPKDDQTSYPPDNWETVKTTGGGTTIVADASLWGAAVDPGVYFTTTTTRSGGAAVKLTITGPLTEYYGIRLSDFIPVEENEVYEFLYAVYRTLSCTVGVYAICYQSNKSTITQTIAQASSTPSGSWSHKKFKRTMVANTRYVRLAVIATVAGATAPVVYLDRVEVRRAPDSFSVYGSGSNPATTAGSFIKVTNLATESFDYGNNFAANTFTVPRSGEYQFSSVISVSAVASGYNVQAAVYVNGTVAEFGPLTTNGTGGAKTMAATVSVQDIQLAEGDTVDVYVWTDDPANPTIGVGAAYTNFRGTFKT